MLPKASGKRGLDKARELSNLRRFRRNNSSARDEGRCGENLSWSDKLNIEHNPVPIKNATTTSLKRGTGGRSSFSGIVATVFGSSGFLGRYVVNALGQIGSQLILPYRGDFDDMRRLKVAGDLGQVLFCHYNLKDEASIRKCVQYSNVVVNLVGRDWETKNYKFNEVHEEGARTLARISKEMGVEKFIHVSALNAAESPKAYMMKDGSQFLASKWLGEQAVLEEFPKAVIFRPSDIVGAEDRFARYFSSALRHHVQWLPLYKKGETTEKQPVYVGDVARGIVKAAQNRNLTCEIIQAIGPRRYYLSELTDWFHRVMRKDSNHGYSYRRHDLRWDPLMWLWISSLPKLTFGHPVGNLHWETVERECHSDCINPAHKTLADLGVKATLIEDIVPWVLRPYKAWTYYDQNISEFEEAEPPNYISQLGEENDDDSETISRAEKIS